MKFTTMRRTKNTNYDAELKFTMTKGKLRSLKTSPLTPPCPFIAVKEILVKFSFLPALACAPLWLL